ncbi:MAG TPA: ABC transporter permease [Longimicrobium sp.]|jgi:predicted permease
MSSLVQDLRYGVRALRRSPVFAAVAILTLALGIGANTAIFSVVDAVLLRPLPFQQPERLVNLWGSYAASGRTSTSLPDFLDWRAQLTTLGDVSGFTTASYNLTGRGEPERVKGVAATATFFRTFGAKPAMGRFFADGEDRDRAERVVVLGHGLWVRHFGGRPSVLGETVVLNGIPRTVVGVAPEGFRAGAAADLWVPLNIDTEYPRRAEFLSVVGRMKPGVTLQQVRGEMELIRSRLARQYPDTNGSIGVEVVSFQEDLVGKLRPALAAFAGAVGLVLLIACTNVASLMLTRAAAREREMAVRMALGAGRGRLVRQLLAESVVMGVAGGGVGLLLAMAGVAALKRSHAEILPRFGEVGVDARVLAFNFVLATLTGVLFGLAPALSAGRRELAGTLRGGGRGVAGAGGTRRLRSVLVMSEVALALMLLVGAGLLIRSFARLQAVDVGVDTSHVLTARVSLPGSAYPEDAQRRALFERVLAPVEAAPGVTAAGLITGLPVTGGADYLSFEIEGRPATEGVQQDAQPFSATPGAFAALRIPVRQGRGFGPGDNADAPRVALVSETMARRFWGKVSPLGSRITFDGEDPAGWMTVVGVVGDTRVEGPALAAYPQVYAPLAQVPQPSVYAVVRTAGDPLALAPVVRAAVREADPSLPVYDVATMDEWLSRAVAQPRLGTTLLAVFAAVALALAAVGIYGLIAYTVSQRTREIGVRMALGARPAEVMKMVVAEGMRPALAGMVLGALGAWAASRVIASLLFGITATDPPAFLAAALFLACAAALAAYLPARRAARLDPAIALRAD